MHRGRKGLRLQRAGQPARLSLGATDLPGRGTMPRRRSARGLARCPRGTVVNTDVDSYPESRVHNSQPHGIGRVATLDGLCAWNNLGRNVVFAGRDLRPRAVFVESVFAEDE